MQQIFKYVMTTFAAILLAYGFTMLALDAMAKESEWRECRLHKYHSADINPDTAITQEEAGC